MDTATLPDLSHDALTRAVRESAHPSRGTADDYDPLLLGEPRLERAIGVIYRPETERASHYFAARLTAQFNAVLHFDYMRAVEPLERTTEWQKGEVPETFPSGI